MRRIDSEGLTRSRRRSTTPQLPPIRAVHAEPAESIAPRHVNDYFNAIYCINLARRPDRWAKMTSAFERHRMDVVRVDAIDGKDMPPGNHESGGAVGCALSHAEVHKRILVERPARALILEDDVAVPDDLPLRIARLARFAGEWDALILGRSAGGWGAFAYGVTPHASAIMLPRLEDGKTPADHVLLRALPHLVRVHEHQVFLHDNDLGSDIHPRGHR